jgi:hypothetical protein
MIGCPSKCIEVVVAYFVRTVSTVLSIVGIIDISRSCSKEFLSILAACLTGRGIEDI